MILKRVIKAIFLSLVLLITIAGLSKQAQAATATGSITSLTVTMYRWNGSQAWGPYNYLTIDNGGVSSYISGGTYLGLDTQNSTRSQATIGYTVGLPQGVKVTSAKLYIYGYSDSEEFAYGPDRWSYANFLGKIIKQPFSPRWEEFNITGEFSNYAGGSISGTITSWYEHYYSDNWPYHGYEKSSSFCMYNSSCPPYISLTYEYVPTTPTISSPTAGQNSMTSVSLSANSTVTGGGTINYNWQYSLNGTNYTNIGTYIGTTDWAIPEDIPEGTSIYIRCSATANGVTSPWSTSVRFNKSEDSAVAAKLAAESAEAKAEEARLTTDKVLQLVSRPTLYVYLANGATLTTNALTVVDMVYSNDAGTLEGMEYSYRRVGQGWSDWAALPDSGQGQATVPIAAGFNRIEFCVRNESGIVSRPIIFSIWGLV